MYFAVGISLKPIILISSAAKITAETGMDALTHALEALASNRANYLSDILASQAAQDIMETLPTAYENGNDIKARETMVQASMVAGIAFTNVSLGIVHSMAHTIGGIFHVSHGLADAIILPYIIRYNEQNETAKEVYAKFAKRIGAENLHEAVEALNEKLNIPKCFKEIIPALFWQSSDVHRLFPATRSHLHPRMQFHSSHKYRISREYFQVSARLLLRCGYKEAQYIQCPLPRFHLQFLPGRPTSADMSPADLLQAHVDWM